MTEIDLKPMDYLLRTTTEAQIDALPTFTPTPTVPYRVFI